MIPIGIADTILVHAIEVFVKTIGVGATAIIMVHHQLRTYPPGVSRQRVR